MPTLAEMKCEQDAGRIFVLEDEEIEELLTQLWRWSLEDDKLVKEFPFPDFISGIVFVNKAVKVAQRENYFPKFLISTSSVKVYMSTESAGGPIKNDFIMAAKIDELMKN